MPRLALLAPLGVLALPLVAHAEVSPGNSDLGYKVYEVLDMSSGTPGASLGMVVVVGSTSLPAGAATPFQARTAYWYWTAPNGTGKYCYTSATSAPFPSTSVALKLRFAGTAGGEQGAWAMSASGVVKGCKANSAQAEVVPQAPLDQAKTAFQPTQPGATAWWTVSTSDGSATGAAWLAPRSGGGQDYGWAFQVAPNGGVCPTVPAAPVFVVPLDGSIVLTSVPSTALPTFACAQVGVDVIPP